jgi:hypothetical protein
LHCSAGESRLRFGVSGAAVSWEPGRSPTSLHFQLLRLRSRHPHSRLVA